MKTMKSSEIKEKIIESVESIAKGLEAGEDVSSMIGDMLDLGVYQTELEKSDEEFGTVFITEGIHSSYIVEGEDQEGLMGSLMSIKKAALEKSGEGFSEAVKALTELFSPASPEEGGVEEETPAGGTEENVGGVEKSDKFVWPSNITQNYLEKQRLLKEKEDFSSEKAKVEKFAKIQKEEFSWNSVKDGEIKA